MVIGILQDVNTSYSKVKISEEEISLTDYDFHCFICQIKLEFLNT